MKRCRRAMNDSGKYEAAGSLWWFALHFQQGAVMFNDSKLFDLSPNRVGVESAALMWNHTALIQSDSQEHWRHYDFHCTLPTASGGIPHIKQTLQAEGQEECDSAPSFHNLPLLAGHRVIIAYLGALKENLFVPPPRSRNRLARKQPAHSMPDMTLPPQPNLPSRGLP